MIKTIRRKPLKTKWAAKNKDGTVYEFTGDGEPGIGWTHWWPITGGSEVCVVRSHIKISGDWRKSLRRIVEPKKWKK